MQTSSKLILMVALGLALSLTLSCKDDAKQAKVQDAGKCNDDFSSETQFCYKGKIYEKCGKEGASIEYNPETQFCVCKESVACDSMVLDKCGEKEYNPEIESCLDGKIQSICGEKTYNPPEEDCCYGTIYNPSTQFCSSVSFDKVDKCGGKEYNIETQFCDNGVVKNSQ